MELPRRILEESYSLIKPFVFTSTKNNPEKAHEKLIEYSNYFNERGLDKFLFDCSENKNYSGLEISNAAGFNKNGEFPPEFLKYLGFERVVIGTVTNDSWKGNPSPRIKRYPKTNSLVNWMGLPGEGSKKVAERIQNYKNSSIPLTINFMSTPGIKGPNTPAGADQKRVFTPGNAVEDGSSILVIGRAITGPKTPEERLQAGYEVLQDMAKHL